MALASALNRRSLSTKDSVVPSKDLRAPPVKRGPEDLFATNRACAFFARTVLVGDMARIHFACLAGECCVFVKAVSCVFIQFSDLRSDEITR